MKNKVKKISFFILATFFLFFSCKNSVEREKIRNAKYKKLPQLLKEAKEANSHLDKKVSRALIEIISGRTANEILSLNTEEKNEILRIAITASIDISSFFNTVRERLQKGSINQDIKDDTDLKKKLLTSVDVSLNLLALKPILSDYEYLQKGELDSIMFSMAIVLGKAVSIVGYNVTEGALKEGNSKDVEDFISKTNIEVVLYSYGAIRKREDIKKIRFAEISLIDLLPEMKVNY